MEWLKKKAKKGEDWYISKVKPMKPMKRKENIVAELTIRAVEDRGWVADVGIAIETLDFLRNIGKNQIGFVYHLIDSSRNLVGEWVRDKIIKELGLKSLSKKYFDGKEYDILHEQNTKGMDMKEYVAARDELIPILDGIKDAFQAAYPEKIEKQKESKMNWNKKEAAEKNPTEILRMTQNVLSNMKNEYDKIIDKLDKVKTTEDFGEVDKLVKEFTISIDKEVKSIRDVLDERYYTMRTELQDKLYDILKSGKLDKEE